MPFGQQKRDPLDTIQRTIRDLAQGEERKALVSAQKQQRERISGILKTYSDTIAKSRQQRTVLRENPQFGGMEGLQSVSEPGLSNVQEHALAADTYGELYNIDPKSAKDFLEFRKSTKESPAMDIAKMQIESRERIEQGRERSRQPYYDYLNQKLSDDTNYKRQRLDLMKEHEKNWADAKSGMKDVFTFDKNGKPTINPKATLDQKLKSLIGLSEAVRKSSQTRLMIDPNDPYSRTLGQNMDAMEQWFNMLNDDISNDAPAEERDYGRLTDEELLRMAESDEGDEKAYQELKKRGRVK